MHEHEHTCARTPFKPINKIIVYINYDIFQKISSHILLFITYTILYIYYLPYIIYIYIPYIIYIKKICIKKINK